MTDLPAKPRRRLRYRGTHPRRFQEKYKELNPEKYPEAVARIVASGKTPAGTHRPVCVGEILDVLAPKPGEIAVDATLGQGGHALELLPRLQPGGRLIGIDTDPLELPRTEARVREAGFGPEQFAAIHTNYAALPKVLAAHGLETVDVVLADLGCSSMQLDDPARGFSHKLDGPLDLRMNPAKGRPASALLATLAEEKLAALLVENADEPQAAALAHAIVTERARQPLVRTGDLARVVRATLASLPHQEADAGAALARVFQALRIAVNDEFSALDTFLRFLPSSLKPGGRVAVLTFHSGEDRRVKHAFQSGSQAGFYADIAREVIRPSREEVRSNPRAGSAKLRWAVRA